MKYVELHRTFLPVDDDQDLQASYRFQWDKEIGGWLDWNDIFDKHRVVLLAEAESGKTEEFWAATQRLRNDGKAAFFVRIEDLADDGFEKCIGASEISLFNEWKESSEEIFLFLDSIDEARLNRKRFDTALRRLSHTLATDLTRAHIFVSCRASDWLGQEDRNAIETILPYSLSNSLDIAPDSDAALLDPIFSIPADTDESSKKAEDNDATLLVVKLSPLNSVQQKKLAEHLDIHDPSAFLEEVWKNGIEVFTERPGDFIEMAEYWKEKGTFGQFTEMTEYSVQTKLTDHAYRPDNEVLTLNKAQIGAERIAAGLTFGKTFTLQTIRRQTDPNLPSGALDPKKLLPEWNDAELRALLRRGIFAPSTYGKVRFHHRSTQEYLAAQWLHRLMKKGCPRSSLFQLLFAETYGVKTTIPSMRPVVAWLSLWDDLVRREVLLRDPLTLLQHGDPGSLSLSTKQKLLYMYASKRNAGEISDDGIDHRSLWMFADPDLSDTIVEVWKSCKERDFRRDLLRIIREGRIRDCAYLAIDVALDPRADAHYRTVAIDALRSCEHISALAKVKSVLLRESTAVSASFAARAACILFPSHLSVSELLSLISKSRAPMEGSTSGFGFALEELWSLCPSDWRGLFIQGLSDLALKEPFVADHQRVSAKYRFLPRHFPGFAADVITSLEASGNTEALIPFLMAIERVDRSYSLNENALDLKRQIQARQSLKRELFWADIAEIRANGSNDRPVVKVWQIYFMNQPLWELVPDDLEWLKNDVTLMSRVDDKRVALSGALELMGSIDPGLHLAQKLRREMDAVPVLINDIDEFLAQSSEDDWATRARIKEEKKDEEKRLKQEREEAIESWRQLREEICQNPRKLLQKDSRYYYVNNLSHWLQRKTGQNPHLAMRHWNLLESGFSGEVAVAYKEAICSYWRETKPNISPGEKQPIRVTWPSIYCVGAIGAEKAENPNWLSQLTSSEAQLAAKHGFSVAKSLDYPDWLDDLAAFYPDTVLPALMKWTKREWLSETNAHCGFLNHFSSGKAPIEPTLTNDLFDILVGAEPNSLHKLELAIRLFQRMRLTENQLDRLQQVCQDRVVENRKPEESTRYIALLFWINPDVACETFCGWLEKVSKPPQRSAIAVEAFAIVFGGFEKKELMVSTLERAKTSTKKQLVRLAYRYVRPIDDNRHEGAWSSDTRDHAESSRNTVLSALLEATGADAYEAMKELAKSEEVGDRADRFHELARGMAERDSERQSWTEENTVEYESRYAAPIASNGDFLQVVLNVLGDIENSLFQDDASSLKLLEKLAKPKKEPTQTRERDEESVQNWLAEQLTLRAIGRFHVSREVEIANKDKPDIIVSSTSKPFEVVIEVKQADSWSPNELKTALTVQLAENYLKPKTRRCGVLVVTNHGSRSWRHPDTKRSMNFEQLVDLLRTVANRKVTNLSGEITVSVSGINAAP